MTLQLIGKVDRAANTIDFTKDTPTVAINFDFGERALVGDLANLGLRVTRVGPDGTEYNQHDGMDLNFPEETFCPYMGTTPGMVIFSGELPIGNTGGTVVVDTGTGYYFHYYHLRTDKPMAPTGVVLQPGGFVGFSGGGIGSPGRGASTGSHLHWGILDIVAGRFIDPLGPEVEWVEEEVEIAPEPPAQGTVVVAPSAADLVPQPWRLFYELLEETRKNPPSPSAAWDARIVQLQERLVLIAGMINSR